MKYRVFDINWDTDGEEIDLPTECEIEVGDDANDVETSIGDKLSDRYGFCHFGFQYDEV